MMFHICTNCAKEVEVKIKQDVEIISVREENISVNTSYLVCQECNMQFHDPSFDPLKEAYKIYHENIIYCNMIKSNTLCRSTSV